MRRSVGRLTECERLRMRLGLTQAQMAERLGVNQATISRLEMGAKPSRLLTILLAKLSIETAKVN